MNREILTSLHEALRAQGFPDVDVHFYMDWIQEEVDKARTFLLFATTMSFAVGIVVGAALVRFL